MRHVRNAVLAGLLGLALMLGGFAPAALAQKTVKIALIGPLSGARAP